MNRFRWRYLVRTHINEVFVAFTIIALSLIIGFLNPAYFSIANLFGILRSSILIGLFAIGVLVVLISGGIDVSFPAIAVFAMYSAVKFMIALDINNLAIAFILAALIGLGLGLFNAIFIGIFRLPTLLVTLGTLSLFHGFLLFFVGTTIIRGIPPVLVDFSRSVLITAPAQRGVVSLPTAFLFLVFFALLVWFVLRYTMLGRSIYALGGGREAAERAGFNITRIQFIIYGFVGFLSGITGMLSGSLSRVANPQTIVGVELDVLAAAVLGGASILGGRGTVLGTLLGVLLIAVVGNSLVLLGIPTEWRSVVVGALILIGVGLPAVQRKRAGRQSRRAEAPEREVGMAG